MSPKGVERRLLTESGIRRFPLPTLHRVGSPAAAKSVPLRVWYPDMPTRIILDTDIGTDIDDVYALLLAAVSPELDLRGVITVNNDVAMRARIARRVLDLIGRADVPVVCGIGESLTPGETRGWLGHEGIGMDLSGLETAFADGGGDWLEMLRTEIAAAVRDGERLTLVTIGAMTDAAAALRALEDSGRAGLAGMMSMASTFEGFGEHAAQPEHNIACDPVAAAEVLASGLPVSLVGLNVTRHTGMDRATVDRLAALGSPAAQAVAGMHYEWFRVIGRDASCMHDPLAIAALIEPDLLTWRDVDASLDPSTQRGRDGAVVYAQPNGPASARCRVAVGVQSEPFHALLLDRVQRALTHITA